MEDRSKVVEDCQEMIGILDNTRELEKEKEALSKKTVEIIVLVENLINKNSTVPMSQEDFQSKYDEYDKEHSKIINKIGKLENEIIMKKAQAKHLQAFVDDLASRPSVLEEWDENVWSYLIDRATVNSDESITFLFINGKEINVV